MLHFSLFHCDVTQLTFAVRLHYFEIVSSAVIVIFRFT